MSSYSNVINYLYPELTKKEPEIVSTLIDTDKNRIDADVRRKSGESNTEPKNKDEQKTKISVPSENANPNIWGPSLWNFLHLSSMYYPETPSYIVRENTVNFINSIPYTLPCMECRIHASNYIQQFDLSKVAMSRDNLFLFYFNFHNAVNARKNKPIFTFEQALKKYSNFGV